MASVTVGERILVHLSGFLRYADAYECPADMTQDGIGAALGISRAHAALELKRLRDLGKIEERMAHVAGARTRRKVYFILPGGQEAARRMREHAKTKRVALVGREGVREVAGAQAIEILRRHGVRETEGIQRILASDTVEIAPPEPAKPPPTPRRPFFGRETEIHALREWLGTSGRPIAIVIGVAGIGKSALLAKVLEAESRPVCLRRLYAHDDGHGFLASAADFLARQGRRRLRAMIARPAYDPAEAIALLRDDLEGCSVAIDDLQVCPAAEGVLKALHERRPACKILIASRTQPTFYDRAAVARGEVLEITLRGLEDQGARDLLASRGTTLDGRDLDAVLRATRGHPLALELFATSGLDAGAVEAERFLVEAVLDGVDDASEAVLKTFSILRRPVLSPDTLGVTLAQRRRLVRRALLEHRTEGYVLHDLVREFFAARLSDQERKSGHERASKYWEGRGDLLESAYHRLAGGDAEGAAVILAQDGGAYSESSRAGELEACLLGLPERLRPLRLLGETQMYLGKFQDARATLSAIVRDGSPKDRLSARVHLGRIANRLGAYAEARAILTSAVQEAAGRDPTLEGEALRALGGVERKLGDLRACLEHLSRASELLEGDGREQARALLDLSAALIALGNLAEAKARLHEAARLARRGSREDAAIQNNLAIVLSHEGKPVEAARAFERSADLAIRTGEMRFASYALANAVDNLLRLDETDAAASCAQRAVSLAETIGDAVALSTARANLGLVFARQREWSKAETLLLESVDLLAGLENPYSLATRYAEIANVYEAQGRSSEAAPWRARAEDLFGRLRDHGP